MELYNAELPVDALFEYHYSRFSLLMLTLSNDNVFFSVNMTLEDDVCRLTARFMLPEAQAVRSECYSLWKRLMQESGGRLVIEEIPD